MAGVDDRSRAPKLLVLMLDLPLGKGPHPVCSTFLPYRVVYRRKALSREMGKELIIPLPHPVRPEDNDSLTVQTAPRKDLGISPHEMLFRFPYLGRRDEIPQFETRESFLKNCILGLSSSLSSLSTRGLLAQTPPLEFPILHHQPGNWVLIRTWKESKLRPEWEGLFQVLLTTETAVRTAEEGWTHYTRVKVSVDPSTWEALPTEDLLEVEIEEKNLVADSEQD
ncbi:uncharacterized protein LOC118245524 isoform X1 [Cygnus atratus]|uniref:uncharacterized protein LOC118245524 isoform X1 n=1 Tax=Cygnus atratus TaxID=8868 RepID=UPI0021B731D7|nr:uncharacterized protein LOC118245524 isoform X1 [Cygnus atratus]